MRGVYISRHAEVGVALAWLAKLLAIDLTVLHLKPSASPCKKTARP